VSDTTRALLSCGLCSVSLSTTRTRGHAHDTTRVSHCDLTFFISRFVFTFPLGLPLPRVKVPGVDIILGGHDHHYVAKTLGEVVMIKSGTDFRTLTEVSVTLPACEAGETRRPVVKHKRCARACCAVVVGVCERAGLNAGVTLHLCCGVSVATTARSLCMCSVDITSDIASHPEGEAICAKYEGEMGKKLDQVLVETGVGLDSLFSHIRRRETNVGNLVCDIVRASTHADIVLLNAGTFRADEVQGPGLLRMRHLLALLPMPDTILTFSITGAELVAALENGVSKYPALEGRFPQVCLARVCACVVCVLMILLGCWLDCFISIFSFVHRLGAGASHCSLALLALMRCLQVSGVRFAFDPDSPPGSRVHHVTVRHHAVELGKTYTLSTKAYVTLGKVRERDGTEGRTVTLPTTVLRACAHAACAHVLCARTATRCSLDVWRKERKDRVCPRLCAIISEVSVRQSPPPHHSAEIPLWFLCVALRCMCVCVCVRCLVCLCVSVCVVLVGHS